MTLLKWKSIGGEFRFQCNASALQINLNWIEMKRRHLYVSEYKDLWNIKLLNCDNLVDEKEMILRLG